MRSSLRPFNKQAVSSAKERAGNLHPLFLNDGLGRFNSNSAAQLGADKSATQHRRGDSTAQRGSNNSAAQLGSGLNANAGAQLDNDTQATSAPPVNSDTNTPEQAATTDAKTGAK
jgi:hypothetical protein